MRFSKEERRALGFIAGMVLLSVLGRWVDRPRPLDTDLQAVNLDSLEAASQAMRPARGARASHPRTTRAPDSAGVAKRSPRSPRSVRQPAPPRDTSSQPFGPASQSIAARAPRRTPKSPTPKPQPVFVPGSAITHIVSTEEASVASSARGAIVPLDLNTASAAELEKLPRVGPVLAARIVAYRETTGRFENVDALMSVKGVGPALLERLRPYLRAP